MGSNQSREQGFWQILEAHTGQPVKFAEFVKWIAENEKVTRTESAVIATLKGMKKHQLPGARLKVGKHSAMLTRESVTVIERRSKQRTGIKRRLGGVLWNILFGTDLRADEKYWVSGCSDRFWKKVRAISQRPNPRIFVDAGSTCLHAIRRIDDLFEIPLLVKLPSPDVMQMTAFEVKPGRLDQQPETKPESLATAAGNAAPPVGLVSIFEEMEASYVRPYFITNSIPIAYHICGSPHRDQVGITVVGGDVRVERDSICGTLTSLCLEAWDMTHEIGILGATGCRFDREGESSLCCDTLSEASLKAWGLKSSLLRVGIFDACKLLATDVAKPFVPINQLHLIVTDCGSEEGGSADLVARVKRFCDHANAAGVATAVLQDHRK